MVMTWDDWSAGYTWHPLPMRYGIRRKERMTTQWFLKCHKCNKTISFDKGEIETQCTGSSQGDTGCGAYTWILWTHGWPTGYDKPQKQATTTPATEKPSGNPSETE